MRFFPIGAGTTCSESSSCMFRPRIDYNARQRCSPIPPSVMKLGKKKTRGSATAPMSANARIASRSRRHQSFVGRHSGVETFKCVRKLELIMGAIVVGNLVIWYKCQKFKFLFKIVKQFKSLHTLPDCHPRCDITPSIHIQSPHSASPSGP